MGLMDLVVSNNTNNVIDGFDEANGIELMEWKGWYWRNQLLELDGNNWIIGNNGTNGSDWAEIIDGTGETYRTLGIDGMETRKEF